MLRKGKYNEEFITQTLKLTPFLFIYHKNLLLCCTSFWRKGQK